MEVILFIIFGAVAVAAAVMMLLSSNAVHSALFLIVTMVCISVLFLMLNAPFLALVQIAVYAGAIMVLFLFVIMLLGAERLDTSAEPASFHWFTPVVLASSLALLITVGLSITGSRVDEQAPAPAQPLLRVVNVAEDAPDMDVYAGYTPLAADLGFADASDLTVLPAGTHRLTITAGGRNFIPPDALTLEPDTVQTLLVYGRLGDLRTALVPKDIGTVERGMARVAVLNGYTRADEVTLVDLGGDGDLDRDPNSSAITDPIIVANLTPGQLVDGLNMRAGTVTLGFLDPRENVIYRMRNYQIERDTTKLIVLAGERMFDGSVRAVAVPVVQPTQPAFGGPQSVGQSLFTRYLLAFEVIALLLLTSMIGAIVLTHREGAKVRQRVGGRRRVSRPLTSVVAAQVGHEVTEPGEPEDKLLPDQSGAGD